MIRVRREVGRWLDRVHRDVGIFQVDLAKRALLDVGILEEPPGSNRGPEIDEYVRAAGSPLGSFWCACAARAWWYEAGARVPRTNAGNCDAWVSWAKANRLFSLTPVIGAAVIYHAVDNVNDANHIGVIVRTDVLLSVEGNTSIGVHDANGIAVALKRVDTSRVLGYVHPVESGRA